MPENTVKSSVYVGALLLYDSILLALFQLERQQSENAIRFQIRVWLCLKTLVLQWF